MNNNFDLNGPLMPDMFLTNAPATKQPTVDAEPSAFNFDLSAFMEDNDQLDESVATNELKEANKRLPSWNLVPPEGYMESLK